MNKTHSVKKKDINPNWHLIDANGEVLGRLATKVSTLLIGKHKTNFSSHINVGDKVIIVNGEKIKVTGKKLSQKMYYRHSGYPKGLKEENLSGLLERKPTEVIRKAVWGMLPVNKLRNHRMLNLYVYKGNEHPHKGQIAG